MAAAGITCESFDGVRRVLKVNRPSCLSARGEQQTVGALRHSVAEQWGWPARRTRLVFNGEVLDDDGALLSDFGLTAEAERAVVRCWLAPVRQASSSTTSSAERGPALALIAARDLLAWARSMPRVWVGLLLWCVSANLAGRAGFGNPYVLLSAFVLIYFNLGQRRAGELSAYNVFNEGQQELLGQLRAEHLEADMINPNRIGVN